MNRRQLTFLILVNGIVSVAIAVGVVWLAEQRRPDLEELAARYTPPPPVILIATPTGPAPIVTTTTPAATAATAIPTDTVETNDPEIYVVEAGDSLLQIALRFGLTIDELMAANNLTNPDFVFVGQRLTIPASGGVDSQPDGNGSAASSLQGITLRVDGAGDLASESLTVINDSDNAVNLQGWTISRSGGPIYTFGDLPIFPGGSIRLHSRSGDDNSISRYWGQSTAVWPVAAVANLRDPGGRLVANLVIE